MKNERSTGRPTIASAVPRYSIRSDSLSWLQDFYKDGALLAQFASFVKLRVIVDANAVLKDLRWLVKNRKNERARPSLLELLEARAITAYAPTFLAHEVSKHIVTIAAEQGLDEAGMRAHWCRYQALIVFVDVGGPAENDGSCIDHKDVPYIELQRRIAAPILTEDTHITMMGGRASRTSITVTIRAYARASATQMSLEVAGAVTLNLSMKATLAAARRVRLTMGPTLAKIPRGAWLLVICIICLAVLHPTSRRRLVEMLEGILGKASTVFAGILSILESLQAEHAAASVAGKNALADVMKELGAPEESI
ncbi:putative PIN domain-containing protein [Paraburkholderia kururiensis]